MLENRLRSAVGIQSVSRRCDVAQIQDETPDRCAPLARNVPNR